MSNTTAPTVANNDYLLVADSSDGNKLLKGPVFDGSTATQALTKKGTWATFNNYSHPTGDGNLHVPATGTSNNGKVLKAGSTAGSLSWGTLTNADVGLGNVENTKLSTWAGTANIKTVGTITTGTWNGTTIGVGYGGTGKTSWTQWGVLYASDSTTLTNTAAGTSGYLLQGNGAAAPSWINATSDKTNNTIVKRNSTGGFVAGSIAVDSIMMSRTSGQYISISSNNVEAGSLTLSTRGTTSAEGWVTLTLGNALTATTAENASGRIYLYSRNTSLQIEAAYGAFNSSVTGTGTGSIYYLNLYGNICAQSSVLSSHHSLIQSNSTKARYGDFEITTSGTTSVEGKASLKLGNARAKGTAENATGQILLYHSDGGASTISAAFDSVATTTKAVKIDTGLSVVNSIETTTGYLYVRKGSIWAGTTANTDAERDVGARAGSGNIYLYATAATTGNRGLQGTNAAGTNAAILTVNQSNEISAMATINCSPVLTAASAFTKEGQSVAFIKGRDSAIIKTTSYSGYNTAFSLKTTAGDWSFGVYSNNYAYLTYASDTNYSSNTNTWGGQIEFRSEGTIVTNGLIGSIGAGMHYVEAQNSTYGNRIMMDVEANGQTAGIWSSGYVNSSGTYTAGAKWLIYRNVNNATVIGDTLWTEGNMYVGSSGQGTLQAGNVRYTSLTNYSSLKVKENIYPISDNDALSLLHINPVYFNYKKGYGSQEKTIGVIAEEVERFVRYIVTESEDPIHPTLKLKGVSYDKFIPYLIKLAQIQQREITNLKSQIQEYMESNAQN